MLEAARMVNEAATKRRRQEAQIGEFSVPLEKRSTRAQVATLSAAWPEEHWKQAMAVAGRAQQRCMNPKASNFRYYGGRGIEFRFTSSAYMADWLLRNLGPKPQNYSLDRIDTNGHYEPGNLRWATQVEQARNRSSYPRGT
jgi:hypothetical protein